MKNSHKVNVRRFAEQILSSLGREGYHPLRDRGSCESSTAEVDGKQVSLAIWKEVSPDEKLRFVAQARSSQFLQGSFLIVAGIEVDQENNIRELSDDEMDAYW